MRVIEGNVYEISRYKCQNTNMAEQLFNALKNVSINEQCTWEANYYNADMLLREAKKGSLWAMYEVGNMLERGIFFNKNPQKAFYWYEKGAKRGHTSCQLALFYMYRFGNGTKLNFYKAIFWLKLSAGGGDPRAMFILGQVYLDGFVEEADSFCALFWLQKSALAGYTDAMLCLGIISEKGLCCAANMFEAYKWYLKAAKQNNLEAHIKLARLVFEHFTDNEKYVKKAVYYLNKSVKMGNVDALFILGSYYKSKGGSYNKKAFDILKKAADLYGDVLAALAVAEMYEEGVGVNADADKAMKYYNMVLNMV